jgi:hypothetical protein
MIEEKTSASSIDANRESKKLVAGSAKTGLSSLHLSA